MAIHLDSNAAYVRMVCAIRLPIYGMACPYFRIRLFNLERWRLSAKSDPICEIRSGYSLGSFRHIFARSRSSGNDPIANLSGGIYAVGRR